MSNWKALKKTGLVGLVCLSSVLASTGVMAAERPASSVKKTQQATSVEQKIRNGIQRSDLNNEQKKIALSAFNDLYQTPKGKEIVDNLPDINIRFRDIGSPDGQFSQNENFVVIRKNIFKDIAAAKTNEDIQVAKIRLAGAYASALTDALQYHQKLTPQQPNTPVEKAIIYKANQLHSLLNSVKVQDQVSGLDSYGPINLANLETKNPRLSFFKKLKAADTFETASLAFADAYWTANTSVSVAGKTIKADEMDLMDWTDYNNHMSTGFSFSAFNGKDKNAFDISGEALNKLSSQMGIKSPSDFVKKTSFTVTPDGVMTYFNGKKRDDISFLSTGILTQRYRPTGSLQRFMYKPFSNPKSNTGKDVFPGTNITRFTYTIKNGKINGDFNGFDRKGNQIFQVPMVNDEPKGDGWILRDNGERWERRFKDGYVRSAYDSNGIASKKITTVP